MADFSIKAHDLLPAVVASLTWGADDVPLDLTDAYQIVFIMRLVGGSDDDLVSGPARVLDPPESGRIQYDWIPGQTKTPGKYQAEWQIVWNTGPDDPLRAQTVPTLTYHSIDILADLDGYGAEPGD